MLLTHIKRHASNIALEINSQSLTYQNVLKNIQIIQSNLLRTCTKQNIALVAENNLITIQTLLASLMLGKTVFLLNPALTSCLLKKECQNLNIDYLLSNNESFENFIDIKTFVNPTATLTDIIDNSKLGKTVIFSSGTTKEPKKIVTSTLAYLISAKSCCEALNIKSSSRYLHTLPLCHVSGLSPLFRSLYAGGSLVLSADINDLYKTLKNLAITHVSVVLTQLKRLLDNYHHRLTSLEAVLAGGSKIYPDMAQEAYTKKLPLYLSYGMTETSSMISCQNVLKTKNFISSGTLLPHCKLNFSKDNSFQITSSSLFDGYLGEDGSLLRESPFESPDFAKMDEMGFLYILGRKDDVFISGGYNISPSEIEDALLGFEHITHVKILPTKSLEYGTIPVAFYQSDKTINLNKLKEYLRSKLKFYQIPKAFISWQFPHAKPNKNDYDKMLNHFQNINQCS